MNDLVRDSDGQMIRCEHPALTRICRALARCPHRVFAAGGCDDVKSIDPPRLVETVTPEGLRARAAIMRARGDESCARHLETAASRLSLADFIMKNLDHTHESAGNLTAAVSRAIRAWREWRAP